MTHLEVVVPCYNEQECIRPLYEEMNKVLSQERDLSFSILFIDDGSKDETLSEIKKLVAQYGDERIRYLSFARNFGKEAAIYAGLENSRGDLVALMDADLQHPPELLPRMIEEVEKGADCCGARRISRDGEPAIRSFFSSAFYKVINHVTSMQLIPGGSDFRVMTKQMADAVVSVPERERFTKGIMSWVGFDTKWIEYENVERYAGTSKWSFWGLTRYAWRGFMSFATTPLRAAVVVGVVIIIISIIYAIRVLAQVYSHTRPWTDTTTIILLVLFIGGVLIALLGVIGEYLAKIYLELKHRPIYIAKESSVSKDQLET